MDFSSLCNGCRTYRRFKQTPIPEKDLQEIMENVRIVSSAMNGQILRYVLVKNPELVRLIQPYFHFAGALPPELGEPKKRRTAGRIHYRLSGRRKESLGGYRYRYRCKKYYA